MTRGMRGSMNMADGFRKVVIAGLMAGLIAAPALARSARGFGDTMTAQAMEEPDHCVEQQSDQDRSDAEQDARERADEKREREHEKKEQEQERIEHMQELYDDAGEALNDGKYQEAEKRFAELAQMNGPQTDAALYWKAYTENQAGKRDTALATIANLKAKFPQSRWKKDAEALQIEVQQSTGRPANPEAQSDEELKTLALQGLMNSDPHRGMEMIQKRLAGPGSPKYKATLLFCLRPSGSTESKQLLEKIALGQRNPELQRKAVEYLGIFGGVSA